MYEDDATLEGAWMIIARLQGGAMGWVGVFTFLALAL